MNRNRMNASQCEKMLCHYNLCHCNCRLKNATWIHIWFVENSLEIYLCSKFVNFMTKRKLAQNFCMHAKRRLFLALNIPKIATQFLKMSRVFHRTVKIAYDISMQINESRRCYRRTIVVAVGFNANEWIGCLATGF